MSDGVLIAHHGEMVFRSCMRVGPLSGDRRVVVHGNNHIAVASDTDFFDFTENELRTLRGWLRAENWGMSHVVDLPTFTGEVEARRSMVTAVEAEWKRRGYEPVAIAEKPA